jgi:hypothetical protein
VPAAAVIRRVRALSGFIGRKELRRRFCKSVFKTRSLTPVLEQILQDLSNGGGDGIVGEAVKCVDIDKNTKGEGSLLAIY